MLWENITQSIDASQATPAPAPALNSGNTENQNLPPDWPAPLVYPQQVVKKRHSLAAIDLPTFPRLQDGEK
jgi:hypothetical protein